jgi:two-component system, sensor histidine kinase PdtaS
MPQAGVRNQTRNLMRPLFFLFGAITFVLSNVGFGDDDASLHTPDPTRTTALAFFDSAKAFSQTNPTRSLQFARDGLALARVLDDSRLIGRGSLQAGDACFLLGDADSAETFYQNALAAARAIHNDSISGFALNQLGLVSYLRGDYEQAYDRCNMALTIASREGLAILEVKARNYLGLAAQYLGKEHNDQSSFLRALPEAIAIHDTDDIAMTLNHIGNTYGAREMWDSALINYSHALALREQIESNTVAIAILLNNIGNAHRALGHYIDARSYYDQSLAISTRTGSKNLIATTYKNLAILLRMMNEYTGALQYAGKARELSLRLSLSRIALQSTAEIATCQAALGRYSEAYGTLQAYIALGDSLNLQVDRRRAAELQIRFESEGKERQIQDLALSKARTTRNFLAAIVILALLLAVVLFRQYKLKSKVARETAQQKAELERVYRELVLNNERLQQSDAGLRDSLREKEVLLKEIHHRVKNNLQIVSSLLNLQVSRIANPEVAGALRTSQDRIRSMALIHERLYGSGDFARIEMKGYLGDLVVSLRNSYDAYRIDISVESEPIKLPLDTAIPLGLIVSELVTNAFKHGFLPETRGQVVVSVLSRNEGECSVEVKDNGKGLPDGFHVGATATLGLQLVEILTQQLNGHLTASNDNGTTIAITFPVHPPAQKKDLTSGSPQGE